MGLFYFLLIIFQSLNSAITLIFVIKYVIKCLNLKVKEIEDTTLEDPSQSDSSRINSPNSLTLHSSVKDKLIN